MGLLARAIVMLSALVAAATVEKSSTYMKNSDSEDMVAEATGYDYQDSSGVPVSYKTFKTDMAGKFSNLDYPSVDYGGFKYHYLPLKEIPVGHNFVPSHYDHLVNSYGAPISYAAYVEPIKGYDAFMESLKKGITNNFGIGSGGLGKTNKVPSVYGVGSGNFGKTNKNVGGGTYGVGPEYDKNVGGGTFGAGSAFGKNAGGGTYGVGSGNFGKSGGITYGDSQKASHGEKGERGYVTYQEFDKAQKGVKDKEENKGFYKGTGGNNGGFYQASSYFHKNNQGGAANKGESFSGKKDNNKGSKTTGYHKVYLKDDYNKDHTFYDKADKNGYFRRYGDFKAGHGAQAGGFKEGGRHDSGFYGDLTGAKGYSDKGKVIDESKGYKGATGGQKYYENEEEFSKKGGNVYGKEQGFKDGGKFVGR